MDPRSSLTDRFSTAWRERAFMLKAMSFALVGFINSAVDFAVFSLAYYVLHLPIVPANVMSWCVAVTGSYVLNTLTTFANESGGALRWRSYFTFAASQAVGLVANTITVLIASDFVPVWAGKLIAIGVSFLVNFSLSHFVVFRRRSP